MKRIFLFLAFSVFLSSINLSSRATVVVPVVPSTTTPSGEPDPGTVKAALEDFKSLSKKERKARIKEAKKEIKAYKKQKRSGDEGSENMVLLCILAILLPPLAVYLHEGEINNRFWISILLTLLFWIPGVIYAFIIILGDN